MLTRRTALFSMLAGALACLVPWRKRAKPLPTFGDFARDTGAGLIEPDPDFGDSNTIITADAFGDLVELRVDRRGQWWFRTTPRWDTSALGPWQPMDMTGMSVVVSKPSSNPLGLS